METIVSLATGLSCLRGLLFLLCITIICRSSRLDMLENIIGNHAVALTSTPKGDCWRGRPIFVSRLTCIRRFI